MVHLCLPNDHFSIYTIIWALSLIVVLSMLAVLESWYKERHHSKEKVRIDQPQGQDLDKITDEGVINYKRAFVFTALIALYIFLLDKIGYFIVTPLFILIANYYLKSMSLKNSAIIAVLFSGFVYALFVVFLKIPIPMGLLK